MMITSRYKPRTHRVRSATAHPLKWASSLCLGTLLALASQTHAENIDFTIDEGAVVPTEDFAVKISVLGAAITSSGTDIPVTLQVFIDGVPYEPFGPAFEPSQGDVNDHSPPRHFVVQEVFDPQVSIHITGISWLNGNIHLMRNSHYESSAVKVLRNGDPIPDIQGFDGQSDAVEFVQQYIDTESGVMALDINQSIYLFEIGTTRLSSSAADFQDLVVLVTLGKTPEELMDNDPSEVSFD